MASRTAQQADNLKRIVFYGKGDADSLVTHSGDPECVAKIDEKVTRLIHAGLGMLTESVEFLEAIEAHLIAGEPLDQVNMVEEVGDLAWYQAVALDALGSSFEAAQSANIAKLAKRYPQKFSEESAMGRNLGAERSTLEERLT